MNTKAFIGAMATVAVVWLSGTTLFAQDRDFGAPPGGGPGGNFDPTQFRQRMMEQARKNLSVTNDEEWGVIQPLIQKVMDARRENFMGGGMGMMMGPGGPPPGGGPGGPPPDGGQGGGPGGRGGFGPPQSAEQQALQKVISGDAAVPQIKDALAKFRAARKDKQAKLEAAQSELRNVLTLKQEAQAVLMGLLQ